MDLKRTAVSDGVSISCYATDKFKAGAITIQCEVPLDINSVTLCNLLSRVMRRGCKKYPNTKTFERKLDMLYSSDISFETIRRSESEFFCVSADFLSRDYTDDCDIIDEMCNLLADTFLDPLAVDGAFDKAYTESEKKNLADEINSLIDNKTRYARSKCIENMCADEKYSIPVLGEISVLEKITPEELYDYYKKLIKHSRMEILYTGSDLYFDKVSGFFKEVFSKVERGYAAHELECEVIRSAEKTREIVDDMEINQGKLSIGFRTGITINDPDFPALAVFNEIFGGSPNSKLFMNVREKMSLCYYCSSMIDALKGVMLVNAGIESDNFEVARDAILRELDDMKKGNFTEKDMENARRSLINGYKSISDSIVSLESWYVPRIFRNKIETPDMRIEQTMRVTKEEVRAAAEKISCDVIYFLRGTLNGEEE